MPESLNAWISPRAGDLADRIMARQLEWAPDLKTRYGPGGWKKCVDDTVYHLEHLAEAVDTDSPELMAHYLSWLRNVLEVHDVDSSCLEQNLSAVRQVLDQALPGEFRDPANRVLDAGTKAMGASVGPLASFINESAPYGELAGLYLSALLSGDRKKAGELILGAVDEGAPVEDIYRYVFQVVQREIGRLWQINEISVAQEHFATAVTQLVMSQLYPKIFSAGKKGHLLVAACVGGELHEIGVRMVADIFELNGWDTYYIGANTPAEAVSEAITDRRAEVLAVSVTLTPHLSQARQLIDGVRQSLGSDLVILAGGPPFNVAPDLFRRIGADGTAPDAWAAVKEAERLVGTAA